MTGKKMSTRMNKFSLDDVDAVVLVDVLHLPAIFCRLASCRAASKSAGCRRFVKKSPLWVAVFSYCNVNSLARSTNSSYNVPRLTRTVRAK